MDASSNEDERYEHRCVCGEDVSDFSTLHIVTTNEEGVENRCLLLSTREVYDKMNRLDRSFHSCDVRQSSTGAIPSADDDGELYYRNPGDALAAELSRSTSVAAPHPVKSPSGPTVARAGAGEDARSLVASTARSSLNETTTMPLSARSVSFKEPVVNEIYDPPSSHSQPTNTVVAANRNPALEKVGGSMPSDEYQQNMHELEQRTQLINDEVRQLRLHNTVSRRLPSVSHVDIVHAINLESTETTGYIAGPSAILAETIASRAERSTSTVRIWYSSRCFSCRHSIGSSLDFQEQTKDLQVLNRTLQSRCDQLQNELITMRDRYTQSTDDERERERVPPLIDITPSRSGQNQSSVRELKNENHFLKDYIHRLNAASSEYQTLHPPTALKKDQRKMQGLPMKGPSPIWLVSRPDDGLPKPRTLSLVVESKISCASIRLLR